MVAGHILESPAHILPQPLAGSNIQLGFQVFHSPPNLISSLANESFGPGYYNVGANVGGPNLKSPMPN